MNALSDFQGDFLSDLPAGKCRTAWIRALAFISTALFLALGSATAQARVIYVNGQLQTDPVPTGQTWATAWNTIGAALKDAGDGDEIWVAQGTYKEFVTLTNGVALYGGFAGAETDRDQRNFTWNTTTIYGDGGGISLTNDVVSILEVTNTLARLDGFTVDKDPMVVGSAIRTSNASPIIANNRICGLTNFAYGVIQCQGGAPLIASNNIANNITAHNDLIGANHNGAGGIYSQGSDAHIVGNRIIGNSSEFGAGIKITDGSPLVEFNDIMGNSAEYLSGGLDCWNTSARISNNRIIGNSVRNTLYDDAGAGISIENCRNVVIANNLVMANYIPSSAPLINGYSGGISCRMASSGMIVNNTVIYNQGGQAAGLWCECPQVSIANNIIAFGSSGVGRYAGTSFLNNCIYGNGTNNFVSMSDQTGTNGNIALDPMLDGDAQNPGWHLMAGSPCIGAGVISPVSPDWQDIDGEPRIQDSHVDIGSDAFQANYSTPARLVCYVSPAGDDRNDGLTWATAKHTVQVGLDRAALSCGEVWVAAGCYPERIAMRPYVDLYGGFSGVETNRDQRDWKRNETILDSRGLGSVVLIQYLSTPNRMDGFTIQNGLSENGGGILAKYSLPIVANNIIQNNTATNNDRFCAGGGVYSAQCTLVLSNNLIQNNLASSGGGVSLQEDRGDVLTRNTFKSNLAVLYGQDSGGGGIYAAGSLVKILNNVFDSNVFTNKNNPPTPYPYAYGGAIRYDEWAIAGSPTNEICNNTFINNKTFGCAESGGIALVSFKNILCANNLLAYNSSGLFAKSSGNIQWMNNCVWSNYNFNYNGIANQTGTNGNISAHASFAIPPQPYLLSNSPCIDAGIILPGATDELDWAGNPRLVGSSVDIGAVEYSSSLPPRERSVYFVSTNGSDTNGGHSWLDAKQTVQAGINAAASDGGEVWVKAGKYIENLNLLPFVALYGGFSGNEISRNQRNWNINPTILDGGGTATVVMVLSSGEKSVISGFIIQNGAGTRLGGGIYCGSSSPTISENRIIQNIDGPGISCENGAPLIYNNLIAYNTNTNSILGTYDHGTSGISISSSPEAKIINNTVVSNCIAGPGYYLVHGAVYSSKGGVFLNNLVAYNNDSGIQCVRTWPNSILSNNCVYGNIRSNYYQTFPGSSDISVDPLFIPCTSQLSAISPCIDAGNDAVITPDMLDLAGTPRIQGTHVDIGTFEYAPAGEWVDFVPGAETIQITPVTVGGITYVPWRFEFAESRYRMAEPEAVETNGTNFTARFHLQQWTGAETPGTNAFSGTFILGALNPGDYAFVVNASSNEVKTVPFSVTAERTATLSWQPRTEGALKLQVAGVADVTYRLLCATNLVDWTILSTHRGAPFELEVTNNPDLPTLFYRVEVAK